jgi:hypothetical protein
MLSSINLMIKRLLPIALATSIPAACAYPSISEIKNPPAVDVAVNVEKAVPIEVVKKEWKCPRVPYNACHSGGYGLIQWTSVGRYRNLGKFATKYGYDPSSLEGQTAYMINESVFQRYLPEFEGNGKTVDQYMVAAYYWLGWGIKGYRQQYAYDYTKKLIWA